MPGQWLDTFIPGLPKAGGFTITSTPTQARPSKHSAPYLELAIQKSSNPPAQWLWQPQNDILGSQLVVRVGGSFTWPPPHLKVSAIDRLVLVAGGVGIKYHVPCVHCSTFANNYLVHLFQSFQTSSLHFRVLARFTSSMEPKLHQMSIPSKYCSCLGLWIL